MSEIRGCETLAERVANAGRTDVLIAHGRAFRACGPVHDTGGAVGLFLYARGYRLGDELPDASGPTEPLRVADVTEVVDSYEDETWWDRAVEDTILEICDRPGALVEDVSHDPEWLLAPSAQPSQLTAW